MSVPKRGRPSVADNGRSRGYCFTAFPSGDDCCKLGFGPGSRERSKDLFDDIGEEPERQSYVVAIFEKARGKYLSAQFEACPNTGRIHLQAYIEFKEAISFNSAKTRLPEGSHIEIRKGSRDDARDYCRKDESRIAGPYECGEWCKAGQRTDLEELFSLIKAEKPLQEIIETNPTCAIRNWKHLKCIGDFYVSNRDFKTKVIWCYGCTGSGKSRWAFNTYPNAFWKPNNRWWDGYDPREHETVIWDDWAPDIIGYKEMLRLMDRYPMFIEQKGLTTKFRAKTLVFTSIIHPRFMDDPYSTEEFLRRIDESREFLNDKPELGSLINI